MSKPRRLFNGASFRSNFRHIWNWQPEFDTLAGQKSDRPRPRQLCTFIPRRLLRTQPTNEAISSHFRESIGEQESSSKLACIKEMVIVLRRPSDIITQGALFPTMHTGITRAQTPRI